MDDFENINKKIGNTPLVDLKGKYLDNSAIKFFAKLENYNYAGSAKDRVALQIILDAEKVELLKTGSTIVEATSGNTGIGLAAVGASRGYKVKIFMPSNMSKQRISLIEKYGGQVVLTDEKFGMQGSIDAANSFAKENDNVFLAKQFENKSNSLSHYLSTGPEIYKDLPQIDAFICGIGTGGSITGIGKYLKEQNPKLKIIGVEPAGSAVLSGKLPGPHKIQGIGAGFVPSVLDTNVYDEIITVEDEEAFEYMDILNNKEKLNVGISSGAAFCAACKFAKAHFTSINIVFLCPDSSDRYV